MRENDHKCFREIRNAPENATEIATENTNEISFKETYIKSLMEITREVKVSLTEDLFDSLEVQVKENASDLSSNSLNTVTASWETLNFDCIEQYLDHALNFKEGDLMQQCQRESSIMYFEEKMDQLAFSDT